MKATTPAKMMQRTEVALSASPEPLPLRPNPGQCRCGAPSCGTFAGEPVCVRCGGRAQATAELTGRPERLQRWSGDPLSLSVGQLGQAPGMET